MVANVLALSVLDSSGSCRVTIRQVALEGGAALVVGSAVIGDRGTLTCVRGPSSRTSCNAVALVYDSAASDPQDRTAASSCARVTTPN